MFITLIGLAIAGPYQDGVEAGKADAKELAIPYPWIGVGALGGCVGGIPCGCLGGSIGCLAATGVAAAVPPKPPADGPEGDSDYSDGYYDGYTLIVRRNRALAAVGGGAATTAIAAGVWFAFYSTVY